MLNFLFKIKYKDANGSIQENCAYNNLNQLTIEDGSYSDQFRYDSLNCLEKDGQCRSHNSLNQMLSDSKNQFSYYPNGNLAQIRGQENIDFQYDALDRLVIIVKDNTKVCYTYDHFNRRIKKELFVEGTSQQVQQFLYVGQDEIGAVENGQITELRILGEGQGAEIGSAIAIELDNRTLIPIHNMRGDICCLIDSETKEIIQNCQFSAFGEQSTESIIPWGFSSKRLDPETGFIYFGRRYYSPSLGRWITPDPIGYPDGPNLYAYVHNSPLTHFDLYGLYSQGSYSPFELHTFSHFSLGLHLRTCNNIPTTNRFLNFGLSVGQGFSDPTGTLFGYGSSIANYNFRNKNFNQLWSDFKNSTFNMDRLGEISGMAIGAIPILRGVQAVAAGGRAVYTLGSAINKHINPKTSLAVEPEASKSLAARYSFSYPRNEAPLKVSKLAEKYFVKENQFCLDSLSKAGQVMDRGGLTRAGRALEKHGNRAGSPFPKAMGNVDNKNEQGQYHLNDILTDPKAKIIIGPKGDIRFYAIDGRGAHFRTDGTFKGFLDYE